MRRTGPNRRGFERLGSGPPPSLPLNVIPAHAGSISYAVALGQDGAYGC
jgi:hypothetical protein